MLYADDGGGMDPHGIRKCMSLGYSLKKSKRTIGQYGNGFKTSTMRLGPDAIVFGRATRGSKTTQSIGILSYTFLRKTGQDDVIVLMFEDIGSHGKKVIIYNLWLNDEGIYELSFDDDDEVIAMTYKPGQPLKQVLVVVTTGWHVMCFDHNLKKLWEVSLQEDFSHNAHHREIAISISNRSVIIH